MAVRTIGTDIKLTGEKEFNDGMKAINSNLKTLRSDMAAVSATFEDNAGSVEALTAKNKILQDSVEQQRVKVDALRQMYEKVSAASGENSAAADKWKQQLNNATVALVKEEKALRQNNAALEAAQAAAEAAENASSDLTDASEDVAKTADKAAGKLEDLADANKDVSKAAGKAADDLDDVAEKAEKNDSALPKVAEGLGKVASAAFQAGAAVVAVSAAMGTAAVTAMVSFAKESAEAAAAQAEDATAKIIAAEDALANARTSTERAEAENAKAQAEALLASVDKTWLEFSDRIDQLDDAASKAKQALGGVLLPHLRSLSKDGAAYLNNFAQSMDEAAGNTEKQAEVISEYLVEGVELILDKLPEYIGTGKVLLGGLKEGFMEAAPEIWATAKPLIQEWLDGLGSHGPEVIESAIGILGQLISGLGDNADTIIPIAGDLIGALVSGLIDCLPDIGQAAGQIVGELTAYLLDPNTLIEIGKAAWDIGKAIAETIWNAMESIFTSIVDIPGLVDGLNVGMNYQTSGAVSAFPIPGHADGLSRVPYDNYLARLHKDEMVLTAAEAALYRSGRSVGHPKANVNVIINTKTITQEEMEMIVEVIDRKLGDDL